MEPLRCRICFLFAKLFGVQDIFISEIGKEKGVLGKTEAKNLKLISEHDQSKLHQSIIAKMKNDYVVKKTLPPGNNESPYLIITNRVMRTVYMEVINDMYQQDCSLSVYMDSRPLKLHLPFIPNTSSKYPQRPTKAFPMPSHSHMFCQCTPNLLPQCSNFI